MKQDIATCYEFKTKIFNTKLGPLSVTEYYDTFNGLWFELDQYQNLKMECSEDYSTLAKFIKRDRIFSFIFGKQKR